MSGSGGDRGTGPRAAGSPPDGGPNSGAGYRLTVRSTGGERTSLSYERLVGLPWTARRYDYRCASGERWGGLWRGLPVARLLDLAPVGDRATHLLVEGGDVTACVPVATAIDGLLAFERDDRRLPPGERAPRFLAPGIESIRTVKGVERIAGRRLAAGEDRAAHESFPGKLD